MEQTLIWSSLLAVCLLLVALVLALGARWKPPLATGLLTIVILLLLAASAPFGYLFWLSLGFPGWIPAVLLMAGAAAVVFFGRTRAAPGLAPRAASWPRGKLALVFAAAAIVFVTAARNAFLSGQQALQLRRAELVDLERLYRPGVPANLNADTQYIEAEKLFVPLEAVSGAHEAFDSHWADDPATRSPPLEEWTRRNDAAIALVIEGTRRPAYVGIQQELSRGNVNSVGRQGFIARLERQRTMSPGAFNTDEAWIAHLAGPLSARILQRAWHGSLPAAIDDANALLRLQAQTSVPAGDEALERLLAAPGMTSTLLAGLHVPSAEPETIRLQRALVATERGALDYLSFYSRSHADSNDPFVDRPVLLGMSVFCMEQWMGAIERHYDRAWAALSLPRDEGLKAIRAFPPLPMVLKRAPDELFFMARAEGRRANQEVGVALARYRLDHRRWPEKLTELTPGYLAQLPIDPSTGAPLRYGSFADHVHVSNDASGVFDVPP
jgi:hypothetical protein